ncbi:MAG: ABC transporter ATP-binding protein [Chloroflexi bacterium]|jgi:branched-chain amino acid transport system ATP-binding protein|nr:ABC transporter ATP-binding protein [Chloroflexota bacterium]
MAQEVLLKVSNIDVFHGTFQALWDVSLEVRSGEMVALIGANTAGKSTLLDTISGLLHPAKGHIEFEGNDITNSEPHHVVELGITQVPEGRGIFPEMSVIDNIIIGSYGRRARYKKAENLKRVYQHFPILEKRKKQTAKTLSGGEQQMLVIARGLMADPELMLLDEMSLGLAPIVVNELFKALAEIRETGITILFVEQNVRRTLQEADRAYILETGCVTLSGTAVQLREEEEVKKAYFGI